MIKNKVYNKVKNEEKEMKRTGIAAWCILVFFIVSIVLVNNTTKNKESRDCIDYKKASFVYNEYICIQKEYIEELRSILYFKNKDTNSFFEYERKIDSLENALDEMYSVNKR